MSAAANYTPIPLPDFVELPVPEMQDRATAFYETIRKRHTIREGAPSIETVRPALSFPTR